MYVVAVSIFVKPEFVQAFVDAALDNATNTRKEPGNIRFDVLQGEEDAARFMLYEVYQTKEDFVKHQQTAHYFRWRDSVTNWMAKPREAVRCTPVFYGDARA